MNDIGVNQLEGEKAISCHDDNFSRSRLSKQEKKRIKYELRKEKRKEKKTNAKIKLMEKLQNVSHEDKLKYSMNRKMEKQRRDENALRAMNSGVTVCIDLSFNHLNSPREQRSLVKQCTLSYAAIRNAVSGVSLHISSLEGDIGEALQAQGVSQWHIHRHNSSAFNVFKKSDIILLSPDAESAIQDLDMSKVYVVGGIVDRTVRSNITLDSAIENGVTALRLPMKEFFPQAQSHVINIDQVISLFCHYQETKDWKLSMELTIPARRKVNNKKRKCRELEECGV